jgi:hypothetical protein
VKLEVCVFAIKGAGFIGSSERSIVGHQYRVLMQSAADNKLDCTANYKNLFKGMPGTNAARGNV